jgi:glyoxylase-like metal-dependent hydrolase (beta-lactamase superfamily II)
LLKPGDRVGSLEVIASPGHTPGHVAFFDVRDKALIAGDALQTRGGIAVSGDLRLLFPFVAMATWNKPVALTSAKTLRALTPRS